MITKSFQKYNSDSIGALASGLCLVHCIATPFIFIAHTCSIACNGSAPIWWTSIDFIFIGISFFAVYWSAKNSSKKWVTYALWISWFLLSFVLINEKVQLVSLPEVSIYFPAISLVALHFYNRKFCKCSDEKCCSNTLTQI